MTLAKLYYMLDIMMACELPQRAHVFGCLVLTWSEYGTVVGGAEPEEIIAGPSGL